MRFWIFVAERFVRLRDVFKERCTPEHFEVAMHIRASEIFLIHVEETFSLQVSIAVLRCWRMVLELYGLRPKCRKNIFLSWAMRGADNPVPLV